MARAWCAAADPVGQLTAGQLGLDLERDQLVGEGPGAGLQVEVLGVRPYMGLSWTDGRVGDGLEQYVD